MVTAHTRRSRISVVIPAFNERENVPGLLSRFTELEVEYAQYSFEFIVIDDGSTDGTFARLVKEASPELDLTVIQLSRNFGSHYAISAGLEHLTGDCAVVLGADLQEPVDVLKQFIEQWEQGADVVWGVRGSRVARSWGTELSSRAFSYLFARYARLENYPPEGPSGVLLDRRVVREVVKLPERNRNVLALIAWVGYTQRTVSYDQLPRQHGHTAWTRAKMVKLAVDSLVQFSAMPLRACSYLGLGVAAAGLLYAVVLVARTLVGVDTPSGWPTLLVVLLVLGGMQLTVIGVMGEYLWRAVEEVRSRPLYVVQDVWRSSGGNAKEHTRLGEERA